MARLLITGGAGFLGARVARLAIARGHTVVAAGRSAVTPRLVGIPATYVRLDVSEPGALRRATAEFQSDVVVHCAARGVLRGGTSSEADLVRGEATGGAEVAKATVALGVPAVWIGSCAEYAPCAAPIREDWPLEPESPYGRAKLAGWRAFLDAAPNHHQVTLRAFHMYGPGEDPRRLIPVALLAARGRAPNAFGDPALVRDFTFVDDAAAGVLAAAEALLARPSAVRGAVLNLASGRGVSVGDVVREAARCAGRPGFEPAFRGSPPLAGYDPLHLVGDPALIAATLGWHAETPLPRGLALTLATLGHGE